MKVILTTGISNALLEPVSALLGQSGMTEAAPCGKAKLSPQSLQSKLLTSLEVHISSVAPLTQVKPGKLWDELATDLFLANLDRPTWGWADHQAAVLLDFWRQFDPQVRLLLVYNSPASYLAQVLGGDDQRTGHAIVAALEKWTRWNSALLNYQQHFPDVCTLVNSQDALVKPELFVANLSAHWGLTGLKASANSVNTLDPIEQLRVYLSSQLLDAKHPAQTLFQQLEAAALLPASTLVDSQSNAVSLAWSNLAEVSATLANRSAQLAQVRQPIDRADELTQENELLLVQLHQVQEELEHYLLRYQELDKKKLNIQNCFVGEFWVRHHPSEICIDMRTTVAGSNWHGVEPEGRWAGPGKLSTLEMPPMRPGNYALELDIVNAIKLEIAAGMVIEILDQKVPVKMSYPAGQGKLPAVGHASIHLAPAVAKSPWTIGLRFPDVMSSANLGSTDTRILAVSVRTLKLVKSS